MREPIKIVFTDLDGTLLSTDKKVSETNLNCLRSLGSRNIIRVISTGRSLYSYRKLLDDHIPIDYLTFSNGAGIIELRSSTLLHSAHLEEREIQAIGEHLSRNRVDFMVHRTVPENHHFSYYRNQKNNPDFDRRITLYQKYATRGTAHTAIFSQSAQIIGIFPDDLRRFTAVAAGLSKYQVTRTTSPLDGHSIWMEIYPAGVSKGASAAWLCHHLQINPSHSFGVGNDYNDVPLLDFSRISYVVANAPIELQHKYRVTRSNDDNGFSHALSSLMS